MIHRARRDKLAYHLRHLSVGLISNDEFESELADDVTYGWLPEQYHRAKEAIHDDAVIQPILLQCWSLYSDLKNHKLKGPLALSKDTLKIIARYILFLNSDNEYQWPDFDSRHPIIRLTLYDLVKVILTFGKHYIQHKRKCEQEYKDYMNFGEYEYWPFLHSTEYNIETQKPKFLAVLG